jgi:hypothetical protein
MEGMLTLMMMTTTIDPVPELIIIVLHHEEHQLGIPHLHPSSLACLVSSILSNLQVDQPLVLARVHRRSPNNRIAHCDLPSARTVDSGFINARPFNEAQKIGNWWNSAHFQSKRRTETSSQSAVCSSPNALTQ